MLIAAVTASETAWAEKKVALVIGNSAYVHANPLRNPANDARAIAGLFTDLGFEVKLVLDADRAGLAGAIGDFSQLATGADAAIFYYAGHGLSLDERNYLIPVDSDIQRPTDVRLGAAVDAEVAIDQALADAKVKLVFLDACRNNPFVEQIKRSIGTSRAASISNGLAKMDSGVGTLIAFSTAPGQTALDGSGALSPFADALLKELREPGLEVRLAMTKVRADVEKSTGAQQTPWESTNLTGFFYFTPAAAAPAASESPAPSSPDTTAELDLEYWKSVKESDDPALVEGYIARFPTGIYRALAEARFKQLQQKLAAATTAPAAKPQPEPGPAAPKPAAVPASPPPAAEPEQPVPEQPVNRKPPAANKKKPEPDPVPPEKTAKPPSKKQSGKTPVTAGSPNDAAFLSKNIRLNSGVWSLPPGASKLGPHSFTPSFVVIYKSRQYGCHSLGLGSGSTRVRCSPR